LPPDGFRVVFVWAPVFFCATVFFDVVRFAFRPFRFDVEDFSVPRVVPAEERRAAGFFADDFFLVVSDVAAALRDVFLEPALRVAGRFRVAAFGVT
jgi:hypothetical protein